MSVRRRLSKRRPIKEQPQIAKSQTVPTHEDSAADDSSRKLHKKRIPPTKAELDAVADHCVQDAEGNKVPFKQLYEAKPRVLLIFIRHFFCGNCQEYLRTLCSVLSPSSLSDLPLPTSLIVIGCGSSSLIPMYATETSCPFPIYADPNRHLYKHLNMIQSLSLGKTHPDYMQESIAGNSIRSFFQGIRAGRGLMLKGGNFSQNGGEFIFEQGECIWTNRMENTRDHAELADLQRVLNSPEERAPRREKWSSGIVRSLSNRARRQSWDPSSKRHSWSEKRTSQDLGGDSRERSASNHRNNKRHSWNLWSSASGKGFDDRDSSPEPMEVMPEDDKGEAYEESLENSRKSQQQEEENAKETSGCNSGNEDALKALNGNATAKVDSTPDNNNHDGTSDDSEGEDASKLQQQPNQEKQDQRNKDSIPPEKSPTPQEHPSSTIAVS